MPDPNTASCTAFARQRLLLTGPLAEAALAVRRSSVVTDAVLVFDDATGRIIDLDLRGDDAEVLERLSQTPKTLGGRYRSTADCVSDSTGSEEAQSQKTRGRPKLGVVTREVTLLPRQWEWLTDKPGARPRR